MCKLYHNLEMHFLWMVKHGTVLPWQEGPGFESCGQFGALSVWRLQFLLCLRGFFLGTPNTHMLC